MDHGTREETGLPGGRLRDEKPVFFGLVLFLDTFYPKTTVSTITPNP
jgi:hypothetical protein